MRNRPGALNGPHSVVIVPSKENGGAFRSIVRGQIRGLCNHFSLLTRPGGVWYSRQSIRGSTEEPCPLLPPLGEVPRSGKGGAVGSFELFPFNEPHPLCDSLRAA